MSDAIEAAARDIRHLLQHWGAGVGHDVSLALARAAAPHIERAALMEAADSLERAGIRLGVRSAQRWLIARADAVGDRYV